MLRVAAYCRVSTEEAEQLNSLENQKKFFKEYIGGSPDWQFTKLYVDEGISGTSTNKRKGFNEMIKDAEAKGYDLLITKEISRFARNTLDSIYYTRKLKSLGIGVCFMNDNINTLDADSELRLTIMSSIAQEESRKTSSRVRWGQKRSMEQGVVFGNSIFGYYLKKGKLTVNTHEADIVRLIFDLYLNERMGCGLIAKELENRGCPSPSGDVEWKSPSILKILKNEKYKGILKQKKEITPDYLSHKKVKNDGREEYIIIKDNHEPIIDKEIFEKVQNEIEARRCKKLQKSNHSNRYAWSGKIQCAVCGLKFKRKIWNAKTKAPKVVWQCSGNIKYGAEKLNKQGVRVGCNSKAIDEEALKARFQFVLNSVIKQKEQIITELKSIVEQAVRSTADHTEDIAKLNSEIERTEKRKQRLIGLFTDNVITRSEFDKNNSIYIRQIEAFKKQMAGLDTQCSEKDGHMRQTEQVNSAIENIAGLREFSEQVCISVLEKVVVRGRDEISFYLNTGENSDCFFISPEKTLSLQQREQ